MKEVADFAFPVLLWREGYVYLAMNEVELCTHPRSLFSETRQLAQEGRWRLADSTGRCFAVRDWLRVRPFGGLRALGPILLLSVFAVPICESEGVMPLDAFKAMLIKAIRSRFRFDQEKESGKSAIASIRKAESHAEAIRSISPRL